MPVVLPAPDVQANLNKVYNQVLARTYVNRRATASCCRWPMVATSPTA